MADCRVLVLADDLTGALEVGGKFAMAGVTAQVRTPASLRFSDFNDAAGAFVVDTETRHASAEEAACRVRDYARTAHQAGFTHVYKKTDSTLRGNIGAELAALMNAFGGSSLLYVPAYPHLGRTVRDGSLYVNKIRVDATSFATDPFNPVIESHIPTMLKEHCQQPARSVSVTDLAHLEPGTIAVCDGETDDDVEIAARAYANAQDMCLSAGPAGFAAHLARLIPFPRSQPAHLPKIASALLVNGSLHPASRRQVESVRERFRSVDGQSFAATTFNETWTILESAEGAGAATLEYARGVAASVTAILSHAPLDALIVFGGDTAFAIVDALGNPPLDLLGEVIEGIPVSKLEAGLLRANVASQGRDLYLITKAGSFGEPSVISDLHRLLA